MVAHANKAIGSRRNTGHLYFFKGLCLWPLMESDSDSVTYPGRLTLCEMLEPSQVRLPTQVVSLIQRAKAVMGPPRSRHNGRSAPPTCSAIGM